MAEEVRALFQDLQRHIQEGNYARVVAAADKVLAQLPRDVDALRCKAVALVHQSLFEQALQVLQYDELKEMHFEKGYTLFKLNRMQEAQAVLEAAPSQTPAVRELLAQLYYRLENFPKSVSLFSQLVKEINDDYQAERQANLTAAKALGVSVGAVPPPTGAPAKDTYELCYNAACIAIASDRLEDALTLLQEAEELCRETMSEDPDVTEEEIETELQLIKVQLGAVHQMLGQTAEASKLYQAVLKTKPDDPVLLAVTSNNIIALNREHDVFDSKKKIKTATSDQAKLKLTQAQKRAIELNHCLLLMYMNQPDACHAKCKELKEQFPDSDLPTLIASACFKREKKMQQSLDALKAYAVSHPQSSDRVHLALIQTLLTEGKVAAALETVRGLPEQLRHMPGLVGLHVALMQRQKETAGLSKILDDAVSYWAKSKEPLASAHWQSLLGVSGKAKMDAGLYKEAAAVYEQLAQEVQDPYHIALLTTAFARIDISRAGEYAQMLPSVAGEGDSKVDVDALEATQVLHSARRPGAGVSVIDAVAADAPAVVRRKCKRKKRPGKLPKNYNKNITPDPERWLPRWQRKSFAGRRKKRMQQANIGKGTQGASGDNRDDTTTSTPAAVPPVSPVAKATPPAGKGKKGKK